MLPAGALPESPFWDASYWDEVFRQADHERRVWRESAMIPCPGCFHIHCECPIGASE